MSHPDRKPRQPNGGSRDCMCHDEWGKPMMYWRRGKKRGVERAARHAAERAVAQADDFEELVVPEARPLPRGVRGHGRKAGNRGTH